MATAEHAMWVTKRYAALGNQVGFVMVPADQRDAIVADGGAMDTFDFRAFPSTAPPIATVTFTPTPLAADAAVGTAAGTVAATGGTSPYTYQLVSNPGGTFALDGATLETATAVTAGDYPISIRARDAAGSSKTIAATVTVTAALPMARTVRRTAAK